MPRTKKAEAVAPEAQEPQAEQAEVAGPTADDLFKELVGQIKSERLGTVNAHPKGLYARVQQGKRTVGYVVRRKKGVRVYPQALAATMPDGLSFTKCELGEHHYGRGEVILDVAGSDDFADALKALSAAKAADPIPRKEKVAA